MEQNIEEDATEHITCYILVDLHTDIEGPSQCEGEHDHQNDDCDLHFTRKSLFTTLYLFVDTKRFTCVKAYFLTLTCIDRFVEILGSFDTPVSTNQNGTISNDHCHHRNPKAERHPDIEDNELVDIIVKRNPNE